MLSWLINSVTTFTVLFFFFMMLYLKIVFASSKFSWSFASFVSSTSPSSDDCSFFAWPIFGDRITICLAYMIFTLSYDFSFSGLPCTKYICEKFYSCCHCFADGSSVCKITMGEWCLLCSARSGITKCLMFSTMPHIIMCCSASIDSSIDSKMMSPISTGIEELGHSLIHSSPMFSTSSPASSLSSNLLNSLAMIYLSPLSKLW